MGGRKMGGGGGAGGSRLRQSHEDDVGNASEEVRQSGGTETGEGRGSGIEGNQPNPRIHLPSSLTPPSASVCFFLRSSLRLSLFLPCLLPSLPCPSWHFIRSALVPTPFFWTDHGSLPSFSWTIFASPHLTDPPPFTTDSSYSPLPPPPPLLARFPPQPRLSPPPPRPPAPPTIPAPFCFPLPSVLLAQVLHPREPAQGPRLRLPAPHLRTPPPVQGRPGFPGRERRRIGSPGHRRRGCAAGGPGRPQRAGPRVAAGGIVKTAGGPEARAGAGPRGAARPSVGAPPLRVSTGGGGLLVGRGSGTGVCGWWW